MKELKRGRAYDCRSWDEIAVVEVTMRGVRVRYTETSPLKIDQTPAIAIECSQSIPEIEPTTQTTI